MYSILHLSDLHRSDSEPIANETLIASLLADRDRFRIETPEIPSPDALVVSGDIIWGAKLGQHGFEKDIVRQYEVATEFLAELTERLFAGDRSRVVVVPGNHDCCWNTAFSAMSGVPVGEEPDDLLAELESSTSQLRWDWRERKLYAVSDKDRYAQRLDAYWDFVESFYSGYDLEFPIQRGTGYNLFELDEGRILVVAFSSLFANDCFSVRASFEPTAVANAALRVRDRGRHYNLRAAVWHHGIYSKPSHGADYLAINTVHELIGHGFRLGLHGHQHFAEMGSHYVHVPGRDEMAIVSAGSLCAGLKELPRGVDRQYNVVVIPDDYSEVRVHVREMTKGNHFVASAGVSRFDNGMVRMRLRPVNSEAAVSPMPDERRDSKLILEAEVELRSGRAEKALEMLESITSENDPYGRRLLIQAAEKLERWDKLAVILDPPQTADERVRLVEALARSGRVDEAVRRLEQEGGPNLAPHVEREMKKRLKHLERAGGR